MSHRPFGPALSPDEYVDAMVQVAARDASIGRVLREILVGCGLSEAINYSFIPADANGLFSDEPQLANLGAFGGQLGESSLDCRD